MKEQENGGSCTVMSYMLYIPPPHKYNEADQLKQNERAEHVAHMGEERKVYKVLVGKTERKRPLGRPRRRWEDGIRMQGRLV
jgi:hypothetical protein